MISFFLFSSADDGEVPPREKEKKVRPFSMFDTVDQAAAPPAFGSLRKNQSSEDILRDAQVRAWGTSRCRAPLVLEGVQGEVGAQGAAMTPGRLGKT